MERKPYHDAPEPNSASYYYERPYQYDPSAQIPVPNDGIMPERPLLDFVYDVLCEEYGSQAELIALIHNRVCKIIMQPETPEPPKKESSSPIDYESKIKSVLRMHQENTNRLRRVYDNLIRVI